MRRVVRKDAAAAAAPSIEEHARLQEAAQRGQNAGHLAEFLQSEILDDVERSIRQRMFDQIDSEEPLDPGKAVEGWVELRALHRLMDRLRKLSAVGADAGKRMRPTPRVQTD